MDYMRRRNTGLAASTAGSLPIRLGLRLASDPNKLATGSNWTPATGDVKVKIDGATEANIAALPVYANGSWRLILTAGELAGMETQVRIADPDGVIADEEFTVHTFGDASACYPDNFAAALLDYLTSGHFTPGTIGRALQIARAKGRGKRVVDAAADTETLYDLDGTTVIAVFTLGPAGGPYRTATPPTEAT